MQTAARPWTNKKPKRRPRHYDEGATANPQVRIQSAPIPRYPVIPAQTTTSLFSSEQSQQVSQATADILG